MTLSDSGYGVAKVISWSQTNKILLSFIERNFSLGTVHQSVITVDFMVKRIGLKWYTIVVMVSRIGLVALLLLLVHHFWPILDNLKSSVLATGI